MYLKSIEMSGFKSFAHKIKFEFHNGITGIVGPNGSGKSNVSDAVRWVLGEQSAKQLRGTSMQDVIFAGTENRKPLSFAYVAITMDNSDHLLPIDYEEVTIARRVYRSGESEYLLNGTACRLKDVHELFYDTGIGKEGYSIIGQGQIEKILSGKPEDKRELFDEAVGIVKYKKRKIATCKQLDIERDNLVRVNDILNELEDRVGPLQEQSDIAKQYLKKKNELEKLDVNMFLLEIDRINKELGQIEDNAKIAEEEKAEVSQKEKKMREEFASIEEAIKVCDETIEEIREKQNSNSQIKGRLLTQIGILEEQIHSAKVLSENVDVRRSEINKELESKNQEVEKYLEDKKALDKSLEENVNRLKEAKAYYDNLEEEIKKCNTGIEDDKNAIMKLLDDRADIKSKEQRSSTLFEQTNIRKSELTSRIVARKTQDNELDEQYVKCKREFEESDKIYKQLEEEEKSLKNKDLDLVVKKKEQFAKLDDLNATYNKKESKLESLKNISERYDGYNKSIKKVMEKRSDNKGILGVVSDIIATDKKYEIAIETALGGNIQNIVTKDEDTAKAMIAYLKENKLGRATFLPLTSVKKRGLKRDDCLSEKGVIGLADTLIKADDKYSNVVSYLLGQVVVVDHIDNAIKVAKNNNYSLHIVTLDGEYLSPGGALSGGHFKNNSNLLGRKREIEELEKELKKMSSDIEDITKHIEEFDTARELLKDDIKEHQQKMNDASIRCNTAKINLDSITESKRQSKKAYESLQSENNEIETELNNIKLEQKDIAKELELSDQKEKELNDNIAMLQKELDKHTYMETSATRNMSEAQIDEANARQQVGFVDENINRLNADIEKCDNDLKQLDEQTKKAVEDAKRKEQDIKDIKDTIGSADKDFARLEDELKEHIADKEEMNKKYKNFFEEIGSITDRLAGIDKEIIKLDNNREKLTDLLQHHNNYMWEEYELTHHNALDLRDESLNNLTEIKASIKTIKDEIKGMGNVNVNAIDEYKEVSERYNFLKEQHDDLVKAEADLVGIIEELDEGMREQFTKGFADIQVEFNKAFKELFGGGKGTLELMEDEDILETGIRIIAQPPGKKLQNMMQLSGGEKSLTAIALLFAIQNLKPSPFCLLDEIEAALDDSNVVRFANYLHKLTKNTQFIIITHRRGTMNAADRLYGITMQEKGVSALVSVNLIEDDLD
ncbi:MAG: chromosome segregation protein SMC [Lachnospiraceae bacterium]|nr:chromosome segregation protein SMC [Lachnospiraceae bacterium]